MSDKTETERGMVWSGSEDLRSLLVGIASVRRDPGNLNDHDAKSLAEIGCSYTEFGQVKAIVVNDEGMILSGNGQHEAAEQLGWTHIAVACMEGDSVKQLRFAIADNATGRLSRFKEEPLKLALALVGPVPGFDEDMTKAFLLMLDKDASRDQAFEAADSFEAPAARITVQAGELWQLGNHKILCASILHPEALDALVGDDSPGLIFADPPYGIGCVRASGVLSGRNRKDPDAPGSLSGQSPDRVPPGLGKDKGTEVGTVGFDIDPTDRSFGNSKSKRAKDALLGTVGGTKPFGKGGGGRAVAARKYMPVIGDETTETAYASFKLLSERFPRAFQVWWGANHYGGVVPDSSCWLFWDKQMTGQFADGELAYTNGKKAVRKFVHQWNGLMKASERGVPRVHPNQKPTALAAWVYEQYGVPERIVLDPFLGSGPTLWAAEEMGMKVRACELSPHYCSLALNKWEAMTGQTATLIKAGIALEKLRESGLEEEDNAE